MAATEKVIYVYADWNKSDPELMGRLYVAMIRGKELFSFEYAKDWLCKKDSGFIFDPDLHFYEGRQYTPQEKPQFGLFSDSCPDRWGRLLMNRREAIISRQEGRKPRALVESDYLLGVYDEIRMGALRFSIEENGTFLSVDKELAAPPWATLRNLEAASLAFEDDANGQDEKWLKQLLAPGSSLGGARPKASILAPDGSLWIAKFPSKHDEWNSGAWEIVVHDLAVLCGINVPEAKLMTFSDNSSTFLIKRFDRENGNRIHFTSAMALLGKTDGSDADETSYLDIASFIKSNGAMPKLDLKELWKRMVFNMAVSNTDDHLRNHGFLFSKNGWILSPQYDVNPNVYGNTLSLKVNMEDNSIDFELAIETAEYYNIDLINAKSIIEDMKQIISDNWRTLANKYGLGKDAISFMKPAFSTISRPS